MRWSFSEKGKRDVLRWWKMGVAPMRFFHGGSKFFVLGGGGNIIKAIFLKERFFSLEEEKTVTLSLYSTLLQYQRSWIREEFSSEKHWSKNKGENFKGTMIHEFKDTIT